MNEKLRKQLLLELLIDKCPKCEEYRPMRFIKDDGTGVFMCFKCEISW